MSLEPEEPAEARPEPLVRVRDVSHSFDPVDPSNKVLRENTLDLYPGEVVIMTGQSGSGKTTLLTLIGGLRRLQPDSGTIEVLGHQLAGMADAEFRRVRRKIGFIFQSHNLFGSLTALQNVRLAQELDDATRAKVETEIQRVMQESGVPSASVGVLRSGKVVYLSAFGAARLASDAKTTELAAKPEMHYALGSISKQFTSTCVLALVEDGKIRSTIRWRSGFQN